MEHGNLLAYLTGSFVTMVVGAVVHVLIHAKSGKIATDAKWTALFVVVCTSLTCFMVYQQMVKVEEIYSRERLAVQFFPVDGPINCFDEAARLVKETQKGSEVFLVNYFPYIDLKNKKAETSRRDYMKEMEERLGNLNYHRIVQVPPEVLGASLRNVVGQRYLDHFRAVVHRRDRGNLGGSVQLQQVAAQYPMTFVIIKNPDKTSHMILEVRQVDAEGVQQAIGALILSDPEGQVIPFFEQLYNNLQSRSDVRPISLAQLQ